MKMLESLDNPLVKTKILLVSDEKDKFSYNCVDAKSCIHLIYNIAAGKKWGLTHHRRQMRV